jgi:type IV secretory pathway VirB10-like protein
MRDAEQHAALEDCHASKMLPSDPLLRIRGSSTRRLRKGRAVTVIVGSSIVLATSLVFATARTAKTRKAPAPASLARATIPDAIQKAPDALPKAPLVASRMENPDPKLRVPDEATRKPVPASGNGGAFTESALQKKRLEAYWAARTAGILSDPAAMPVAIADTDAESAASVRNRGPFDAVAEDVRSDRVAMASADGDPNLQAHKNEFMRAVGNQRDDGYLQSRLEQPRSPYELKAGAIIPAVLMTGINSDLPGPVVARVREDVYDTISGNYLLIPQGSTLLASYDSAVAWGQERVLLCWHRLVLPNGDAMNLECMPGADLAGAAGLADEVDEHWWRIVKGVAIASLLSAATTSTAGSTTGYNPTIPQQWAHGAASEIGRAGEAITRRNIMIQPTITVRPGWSMNVMVTKDMILAPVEATF